LSRHAGKRIQTLEHRDRVRALSTTNLTRWGGIAALVAGLIFVVVVLLRSQETVSVSFLQQDPRVILLVALLGEMAGIAGIHALQRGRYGKLGATGALLVFVSIASQIVGIVGFEFVGITASSAGGLVVALLIFVSALALLVGMVLLGVATLCARVLPSWFGVILIVGLFVSAVLVGVGLTAIGVLAYGCMWLIVGYVLLSSRDSAITRPTG
jgi:hypothetical protein